MTSPFIDNFFRSIFGSTRGHLWVCSGVWDKAKGGHVNFRQTAYGYPDGLPDALDDVARTHIYRDVWWCAQLTETADNRRQPNIRLSTNVWADLDTCDPSNLRVPPTYLIQSSPGRWQALWVLDAPMSAEQAEQVSRKIAYYHANDGADKSGWDLGQLLRVPYTYNHKYEGPPVVELVEVTGGRYRLSDFDVYPEKDCARVVSVAERPQEAEEAQRIIERYRERLPFSFPEMWARVPEEDWSGELWHIEAMCQEAGMTPEETYSVALACGSNKFARDGRSEDELWRDVQKCYTERPPQEEPLTHSIAEYRAKVLRWLWPGWIPLGKLTMFDGDPGLGKSVVTLDIIARVTTAKRFPQCSEVPEEPRDVILCAAEDDIEDTIKPRLMAAGAHLKRVHTIALKRDSQGNLIPLEIPRDVQKIAAAVRKHNAALLVIDPVMGYLGEQVKTHTDASVRKALMPLIEMAQETGCAVLLVRHLNKDGDLKKAIYRGGGSIAFSGAARSGVIFERHPDDKDLIIMALAKANLAKRRDESLGYRLSSRPVDVDDGANEATIVLWQDGSFAIDADTLVSKPDARKQAPERERAISFLGEVLSKEPMPVKRIQKLAKDESLNWRTVELAASAMCVCKSQVRDPVTKALIEWTWSLGEVSR